MGWNHHNIYNNVYLHVENVGSSETCSCYESHLCTHSLSSTYSEIEKTLHWALISSTRLLPSSDQTVSFIPNKCLIKATLQKQQWYNNNHLNRKSNQETSKELRVFICIVVQEDVCSLAFYDSKYFWILGTQFNSTGHLNMSPWIKGKSLSDINTQPTHLHTHTICAHSRWSVFQTPVNQKMGVYLSYSSQIILPSHMEMFNKLQPAYHDTTHERHKYKPSCVPL